jgi:hypothetical protein
LDKWNTRLEFSPESADTLKKLTRIEREREILDKIETIMETEANRFLKHYYLNVDINSFSKEQKMEIVEATIARNKFLRDDDIQFVCTELEKNLLERELHLLLNHRPQFILGIKSEVLQAKQKFDDIRRRHQIDFSDPSTIQKLPQNSLNRLQFLLQRKKEMETSLELMDQLYRHQLDEMYPNWAGRHYLTLEEKEYFVMAKEYYGKTITPEDFSNPKRLYTKREQKEIIQSLYHMEKKVEEVSIQTKHQQFLKEKYPNFQFENLSYVHMFYYECLRFADEVGAQNMSQLESVLHIPSINSNENLITPPSNFSSDSNDQSVLMESDFFSILEHAAREADRK